VKLFSRALAIIYLVGFVSFAVQAQGLIGSQGILPIAPFLGAVWTQVGSGAFWSVPTLFWWWDADLALVVIPWIGAAIAIAAALLPANGVPQRIAFALLWFGYLSLVSAGQVFMGYQWDYLLLEAGFLAIFLTPDPLRVLLLQWLLFRLMFESGVVKLTSHDPTWHNVTALTYHYWTQPLPTVPAWFADKAPLWFQKASCAAVFVIELAVPFLIFGTRVMKRTAAVAIIALQLLIMATGSYTFFNLLTIALCIPLLLPPSKPVRSNIYVSGALIVLIFGLSVISLTAMAGLPTPAFADRIAPFGIVNSYGLFASMTTQRIEIDVQGSNDGTNWQSYEFRYKPGDLKRAPVLAEPYQPRLDWQMWFAALGNFQENVWFQHFALRLLQASPPVLALLEHDPFGGRPPKYIRARASQYRFSDWNTLRTKGEWWTRQPAGDYFPTVSLKH
jgi:hypothetical protein